MAYRHSRRDELAAAKLDALGVEWDRSRGAYRQYRALDVNAREQAIASLQARERQYRPGGRTQGERNPRARAGAGRGSYPRPIASTTAGGNTVSVTGNAKTVLGLVRDAARRGDRVVVKATFQTDKGSYRTRTIDSGSTGSQSAMDIGAAAGSGGLAGGVSAGQRPARLPGAPGPGVQVTTGKQAAGPNGPGFLAIDWLAYFDAYDGDIWDALYAIWEFDY